MARATIRDLANSLGVSTATVSRAFSRRGRISDETRERVLSKAEELGYRANLYARSLPGGGKANIIGFFYPSLIRGEPDYFVTEIMLGISETAAAAGYPLQIHPLPDDGLDAVLRGREMILDGSLGGVIVYAGAESAYKLIRIAEKISFPCVSIGGGGRISGAIRYEREYGTRLAGEYFLKTGRANPVYIGGLDDESKKRGFHNGLGILSGKAVFDSGGTTFEDGCSAAMRILSAHPETDAVLCANDILAIGFIRGALEMKRGIPGEIAVIGCDDIRIARYYNPALTTIRFHEYEIGEAAVTQLERLMAGHELTETSFRSELVIRESA